MLQVSCSCLFWAQSVFAFLLADIIFSTAHKAKGLEFDTVRVTDDFLPGTDIGVAWSECGHRSVQAICFLFPFYCKQFLHVGFVLDWLVTCNKCHVARVLINQNKLSATEQPVNSKPETNYGLILIGNFELLFRLWKWLLLFCLWLWLWFCCSCSSNYMHVVLVFVLVLSWLLVHMVFLLIVFCGCFVVVLVIIVTVVVVAWCLWLWLLIVALRFWSLLKLLSLWCLELW